jgi:ferrous iron transport protein A
MDLRIGVLIGVLIVVHSLLRPVVLPCPPMEVAVSHHHHPHQSHVNPAHLGQLKKGDCATVVGLHAAQGAEQQAIKMRLLELGFAPGEQIRVVAESFPNRDPMAVRVGNTTFALRRMEAALIQIEHTA